MKDKVDKTKLKEVLLRPMLLMKNREVTYHKIQLRFGGMGNKNVFMIPIGFADEYYDKGLELYLKYKECIGKSHTYIVAKSPELMKDYEQYDCLEKLSLEQGYVNRLGPVA